MAFEFFSTGIVTDQCLGNGCYSDAIPVST